MDFDAATADSKEAAEKDVANHLNVRSCCVCDTIPLYSLCFYLASFLCFLETRVPRQVGPVQEEDKQEESKKEEGVGASGLSWLW